MRLIFLFSGLLFMHSAIATDFSILPLGVGGGMYPSNSTAYLIGIDEVFPIQIDGGTFAEGVEAAVKLASLKGDVEAISRQIKAVFISHAHLDHLAGWILKSVIDLSIARDKPSARPVVYSNTVTNRAILDHLFNGTVWFDGRSATAPFVFNELVSGETINLSSILPGLTIDHEIVNHQVLSSLFLFRYKDLSICCFGDTGPLGRKFWKERFVQLNAAAKRIVVIIEVSFADKSTEISKVTGHLTVDLLKEELGFLPDDLRKKILLMLIHLKPDQAEAIREESVRLTPMVEKTIILEQGKRYLIDWKE